MASMTHRLFRGAAPLLTLLLALAASSPAIADDTDDTDNDVEEVRWPIRWVEQPLVVPAGLGRFAGTTLGITLTRRQVGEPIFSAPDLYYGYRDDLTLAMLHDRGICWTEPCSGYDDTRVGALYRLHRSARLELAATGALNVRSFSDPFAVGLRAGATAKAHYKKLGVVFAPELYIGLLGRSLSDRLHLPFELGWQFDDRLVGKLNTGWLGPLSGFSDAVAIPVGLGVDYRWTDRVEVGAELLFENFFGRGATFDRRLLLFRFAFWVELPTAGE